MNAQPKIAVVEDNPTQRMILVRLLEREYQVSAFDTGDAFLLDPTAFEAILLDIEMPGCDGYETCRRYRAQGGRSPIIFVSAHDTPPERVAAYEAGGDDFVTKPIAANELRHKVHGILEHQQQLAELTSRSKTAQAIAFTAMTSMGDLGVVIEFLRRTSLCKDYASLAQQLLDAMTAWKLRGAIQIRSQNGIENRSSDGRMSPLQISVLDNMRDMGRIFEMGSRAVINYERVSLLVENLPVDDPDKVGRLRDHLAVLAESTDMRITGMDAVNERDLQKFGIDAALAELRTTLARLSDRRQSSRHLGHFHMIEALEHLGKTISNMGLTEIQSSYIEDLLKCAQDDTNYYFNEAADLDTEFAELIGRLERLAASDYRL